MRGYIYLTIEGMRSHLGEQPGDNGMLRILRHAEAYDPENDAIFILIVPGDATIIHRSSTGCLTPPEAAEEVARRQVN